MTSPLTFKIEKRLKGALGRAGVIATPHGEIRTPCFTPVGTKATVKSVTTRELEEIGVGAVLANTYHLYLQPGDEIVKKAGGLHKFMDWKGPMLTDSGGFQVFSLGAAFGKELSKITQITDPSLLLPERADDTLPRLAKIGSDGVSFKSHLNGDIHYITPEKSIDIQHNLGADIIFAFDECTSPAETQRYQEEALERTHRWAKRSLERHKSKDNSERQALFGIVQGGRSEALRKESAAVIGAMDFDGFGIGGSFAKEDMSTAVRWVNEVLPEGKPRHLLGIGEPEDLFMGIENGVDLFDCVAPTRIGRTGTLYTKSGKISIMNAKYREDFSPIEADCGCYTCTHFSRAYVCHLFKGKEMTAGTLGSIHNIYFISNLVSKIRQSILDDSFHVFKKQFLEQYLDNK